MPIEDIDEPPQLVIDHHAGDSLKMMPIDNLFGEKIKFTEQISPKNCGNMSGVSSPAQSVRSKTLRMKKTPPVKPKTPMSPRMAQAGRVPEDIPENYQVELEFNKKKLTDEEMKVNRFIKDMRKEIYISE